MVQRNRLLSFAETSKLIHDKRTLVVFGNERLLEQLPIGSWIGGGVPDIYASNDIRKISAEKLVVTDLSDLAIRSSLKCYDGHTIGSIGGDTFDNGFTFLLIPGFSDIHKTYYRTMLAASVARPIIGIVAGYSNNTFPSKVPQVYFGSEGRAPLNQAVAIHAKLPPSKVARFGALNIFEPKAGPVIEVFEDTFKVTHCLVDGKERNLCEYLRETRMDLRFPLTFLHQGNVMNVSFGGEIDQGKSVWFYSPLLRGIKYFPAKTFENYPYALRQYIREVLRTESSVFFNCNGYLNFVHGELERGLAGLIGPATLGEVSFQIHNQVFSYMMIDEFELLSFSKNLPVEKARLND